MHSVPAVRTEYRLINRNGEYTSYHSLEDLVQELDTYHRWIWSGDFLVDHFATRVWYDFNGRRHASQIGQYIVRTATGDIITTDDLAKLRQCSKANRRHRVSFGFRSGPVPSTRCKAWHRGAYRRLPGTHYERTWARAHDEDIRELGLDPHLVAPRRPLPSSWNDLLRHKERSWKSQRRTRWR